MRSALQETAYVHDGEHGSPQRIMIDITVGPGTGDDEDDFLASGSGSGGSGDSASTQQTTGDAITIHHSTPLIPTVSTTVGVGGGGANEQQGETSSQDGLPLWVIVVAAVSIVAVLLLVTLLVVCLVRKRRKAALAQRSARWDRASGAQIAATHKSDERAKRSTQRTSLPGYYLGAPTTPAPTVSPPPPPVGGMTGPVSPPPAYPGPLSPAPLLHYDSLRQDGFDLPDTNGYLAPGGQCEYEDIKL